MSKVTLSNRDDIFSKHLNILDSGLELFGENGNDILALDGTQTPSVFPSGVRNVLVNGGNGNDRIEATYITNSTLLGANGNDTIIGRLLDSTLIDGGNGDDQIDAGGGQVTAHGGKGNDLITTGGGNTSYGDEGDDLLRASGSGASMYGGEGNDSLVYTGINTGFGYVTMSGGRGNDSFDLSSKLTNPRFLGVRDNGDGVISDGDAILRFGNFITDFERGETLKIGTHVAATAPVHVSDGSLIQLPQGYAVLQRDLLNDQFLGSEFLVNANGADLLVVYHQADIGEPQGRAGPLGAVVLTGVSHADWLNIG